MFITWSLTIKEKKNKKNKLKEKLNIINMERILHYQFYLITRLISIYRITLNRQSVKHNSSSVILEQSSVYLLIHINKKIKYPSKIIHCLPQLITIKEILQKTNKLRYRSIVLSSIENALVKLVKYR